MQFLVQKAVQRMQAYLCSTQTRVALDCCCLTIVLHQCFFLMYLSSLAMVEALMTQYNLLYNCSCERGDLIILSCPRISVVLDHPVTVECPCWAVFQQGLLAFLHLFMSLCMGRYLGNLCTSVYFAECSLMVCHANRILATWSGPVITQFHAVIQAGP